MELTKEYFDQGLQNLTKHFDARFEAVDKKFDQQDRDLKAYVRQAFEHQQVYIDERLKELIEPFILGGWFGRLRKLFSSRG